MHYDTAWWRTLNLNSGSYSSSAPNTLSLPLNGRYHDGHARCRSDGSCYGFLLVVYSMSAGQCSFFEEFQLADDPPVTVFRCASPPPSCPRPLGPALANRAVAARTGPTRRLESGCCATPTSG